MKRQNIYKQIALSLLLLVGMAGTAWGQVKENKYTPQWSISVNKSGQNGHSNPAAIFDNNDETWWSANDDQTGPVSIILRLEEDITFNGLNIKRSGNPLERAEKIEIYTLTEDNDSWSSQYTKEDIEPGEQSARDLTVSFEENKTIEAKYINLIFTPAEGQKMAINEVRFVNGENTVQPKFELAEIQHKHAKWHDLRESLNLSDEAKNMDEFDDDRKMDKVTFQGITPTEIQAAHTLVDTIYAHPGEDITLSLPDRLNDDTNMQTYQCWYNFRTGGTFSTEDGDLLTPTTGNYYLFTNGYVQENAITGNYNNNVPYQMTFHYPEEDGEDWYLVACDVSGYKDFTKKFDQGKSKNSHFIDNYIEPTLTHRFIYYICSMENKNSWYPKALEQQAENDNDYLENYVINMPATRIPNHTNELVALSKDASSYAIPKPDGSTTTSEELTVTLENSTDCPISLTSNKTSTDQKNSITLEGDQRAIFFRYKNTNTDKTESVPDGSKAVILVKKGNYRIARFELHFSEESRLLSQSQIEELNEQEGSSSTNESWKTLTYRTPEHLNESNVYELLTELNFDYDPSVAAMYGANQVYPFPMGWDDSSYGFYDGGTDDYKGCGTHTYPEWGNYAILNDFVEVGTWAWGSGTDAQITKKPNAIKNSRGNDSNYHLFVDASDRPGVIARLPIPQELCRGTELFVSAWVKNARWGKSTDNAAMLFTILGVKEGEEQYVPLYRHQTGQIPTTYLNDKNITLPGFGENKNEWFQVYFSFITDGTEYDSYLLQIDNNSASTQGGDMYLDDIRIYMATPRAEIEQLRATCTSERTLLNIKMDWERLLSRTGDEEILLDDNNISDSNEGNGIALCFIDKWDYDAYIEEHPNDTKGAIEHAVRWVGAGDEKNNFQYATMKYHLNYNNNKSYQEQKKNNQEGVALAKDNEWYFYRDAESTSDKVLTVDFYSDLQPHRPYWMLIIPGITSREDLDAEDFANDFDDPCFIHTEVWVTSQTVLKVNGEVIDPTADYCVGQIFNFSAQLRIPTVNENGEEDYINVTDQVYFDWFFGSDEEFTQTQTIDNNTYTVSLKEALDYFRELYPDAESINTNTPANDNFTQEMYNLISYYSTEHEEGLNPRLVLHKENLDIMLEEGGLELVTKPIKITLTGEGEYAQICWDHVGFELGTTGKAPQLHAGFNYMEYPTNYEPNLRLGLAQIQEAVNKDHTIWVDLRGATPITEGVNELELIDDPNDKRYYLYLTNSNDPALDKLLHTSDFNEYDLPVGTITELKAEKYTSGSEFNDHMKIYFDLKGKLTKTENSEFEFSPKEGYWYELTIHFREKIETGGTSQASCWGTFPLTMKVVPEYLIWNGTATGNWNNDGNWKRVADKKRINKPDDDEYPNDNNNANGFVPMIFSKVIIPENEKVELFAAGYKTSEGEKGWVSNRPSHIGEATENIQYDLMVFEHTDETADGTNANEGDLKTERYRVSLCDEIHFEPGAQMLHPEYLLYNKAWVDYELEEGKWYTLASPLHGVVAGDFYTDKSGKEDAEYFTELEFGTDHSRFEPSVYQRAWKSSGATMEQVGEGNDSERAIAGNWSAVYNNVYESYDEGTGFSLKVLDVKSEDGKALFRLPKTDDSYSYYSNSTDVSTKVAVPEGFHTNSGKLKSDILFNRHTDYESASEGEPIKITLAAQNGESEYYLVENPFMTSLNMVEFFETNKDVLLPKYWLVKDDNQTIAVGSDNGWVTNENGSIASIAPLQSFFVQKTSNGNDEVTFTADMQTLSEKTSDEGSNSLILTAKTADGKMSRAAIAYDMSANKDYAANEDAELFLDSNLSDVPAIYTVAGTMATSINRTSELYNIPVGIYGHSTEMVTLSFEGLKHFSSATLYDAEKKTETPLREGTTLTVPASTSGRYFLRAGTPTGNEVLEADDIQIYTLSGNRVMVTSSTPLKDIRVYNLGGALTKHVKAGVCSFELYLPDGIYIVTAENANGEVETEKVSVR